MEADDCGCLCDGRGGGAVRTFVGVDETHGRFGEVAIERCSRCGRLWLCYFVEYEAFSGSARWYRAVVSPKEAEGVKPETAVALIAVQPWHIYGGSYFGHAGKRGAGPVFVDL